MKLDPGTVALFNLVGALAHKLTGERPEVTVMGEDDKGEEIGYLTYHPDLSKVKWVKR